MIWDGIEMYIYWVKSDDALVGIQCKEISQRFELSGVTYWDDLFIEVGYKLAGFY